MALQKQKYWGKNKLGIKFEKHSQEHQNKPRIRRMVTTKIKAQNVELESLKKEVGW